MPFVRHPLVSFFALAYAVSWADWVPLAISGARIYPGSSATHFPGLAGPAIAALLVTFVADGKAGVAHLGRRLIAVPAPTWRFLAYALSPLAFLVLALAVAAVARAPLPPLREYALYSGLPPLGLLPVFALVLLFNGFGEETGWRGFAQPRLQAQFGPVAGTFILAVLWALWHAPSFFFVQTYRSMTLPMIVGGFGLGICAGAFVLSCVTARTGGSVLAAALWHALYNMTAATAASQGVVAAVTTTGVMVWALVVVAQSLRRHNRAVKRNASTSAITA
jgi:membrane protease YdiL (CAAX protease family)